MGLLALIYLLPSKRGFPLRVLCVLTCWVSCIELLIALLWLYSRQASPLGGLLPHFEQVLNASCARKHWDLWRIQASSFRNVCILKNTAGYTHLTFSTWENIKNDRSAPEIPLIPTPNPARLTLQPSRCSNISLILEAKEPISKGSLNRQPTASAQSNTAKKEPTQKSAHWSLSTCPLSL